MATTPAIEADRYVGFVIGVYRLATTLCSGFLEHVGLPSDANFGEFSGRYMTDDGRLSVSAMLNDAWAYPPMAAEMRRAIGQTGDTATRLIDEVADLAAAARQAGDGETAAGLDLILAEALSAHRASISWN